MKQLLSDGISPQERLALRSGVLLGDLPAERKTDRLGTAMAHAAWFLIGFAAALAFALLMTASP